MPTVIRRKLEGGVFKGEKSTKEVKNLGWLFRHSKEVTELHFDLKDEEGFYRFRAVLMDGTIFLSKFNSRAVFCEVFNRNKTLKGVMVFSNYFLDQACGDLTGDLDLNKVNISKRLFSDG